MICCLLPWLNLVVERNPEAERLEDAKRREKKSKSHKSKVIAGFSVYCILLL